MTKAQHTPGPWAYHRGVDYIEIYKPNKNGPDKVLFFQRHPDDEDEANARFIVAAHAFLRALRRISILYPVRKGLEFACGRIARRAIAKVEGGRK